MEILRDPEFWVGVGFAAVIVIFLWKGAPGVIAGMLDKRAHAIAAELAEARRLRDEAAALLADYQARALGAEKEAQGIVEGARASAARFAGEARAALELQIGRRAQAAQDKIAQAEAAALSEIRGLAADAAIAAAEKIIVARMDEKRAGALIDEGIKDLGAKLN